MNSLYLMIHQGNNTILQFSHCPINKWFSIKQWRRNSVNQFHTNTKNIRTSLNRQHINSQFSILLPSPSFWRPAVEINDIFISKNGCIRWDSFEPPKQTENVTNNETSEPPIKDGEISDKEETVKQDNESGECKSPKRSVLKQATRFVINIVPGHAHVVMQQQHLLARLPISRLRGLPSFTTRKGDEAMSATSSNESIGRRSSRRKRNRAAMKAANATGVLPTKTVDIEDKLQQHRHGGPEHQFLKDTTIEEIVVQQEVQSVKESMNEILPVGLQPSLEVTLGWKDLPKSASSSTAGNSFYDSATPGVSGSTGQLDKSELLRNYEAVLQVVLASGVIEPDAKRFLKDYRKRFNINTSQHDEGLKRLGWSNSEYDQGFSASTSVPHWRVVLNRFVDVCESGGNYIVTLGSLASLASIMMSNMAQLRMFQLVSGTLYFLYNVTRRPPLVSSAYWNLVFFVINSVMLIKLFLETRPEAFSEDELDVFEKHFLQTGLTPRKFKKLLAAAEWRHAPAGEVLIHQGDIVKELMIVHKGELSVRMNDSEVERLVGGDMNAIIGLKTFLTRIDHERRLKQKPTTPVEDTTKDTTLDQKASMNESEDKETNENRENNEEVHHAYGSHTTVVAAKDVTLLVWPMDELVKKVVSDPVNLGFPLVGGMAKSLVARSRNQSLKQTLSSYETAIKGVLADGVCGVEEKKFLNECRQKFNVTEDQHWELVRQLGWTKEEFEAGTRSIPSIMFVLTKVKEQLGLSFQDSSSEEP